MRIRDVDGNYFLRSGVREACIRYKVLRLSRSASLEVDLDSKFLGLVWLCKHLFDIDIIPSKSATAHTHTPGALLVAVVKCVGFTRPCWPLLRQVAPFIRKARNSALAGPGRKQRDRLSRVQPEFLPSLRFGPTTHPTCVHPPLYGLWPIPSLPLEPLYISATLRFNQVYIAPLPRPLTHHRISVAPPYRPRPNSLRESVYQFASYSKAFSLHCTLSP